MNNNPLSQILLNCVRDHEEVNKVNSRVNQPYLSSVTSANEIVTVYVREIDIKINEIYNF